MPAPATSQTLLSPAELSYLSTSLHQTPPIRPDLRSPTQFRPLFAETDILPSTNGSARVCFSDGTEAIAGVKAEVERTVRNVVAPSEEGEDVEMQDESGDEDTTGQAARGAGKGRDSWLEISIEIPGFRDDDALPIFMAAMLTEALLANGSVRDKLWINDRWHWKLYIDILSLSPPLSYPLPLLSLTTHLALLNTALPRLTSEPSDDPLFDDDWDAAVRLYPHDGQGKSIASPPVTLLVITVGDNIIFDPSKEELAVAESVIAVSVAPRASSRADSDANSVLDLIAVRVVDPPSRLTPLGVSNSANPAAHLGDAAPSSAHTMPAASQSTLEQEKGAVWSPPKGGIKRALLAKVIKNALQPGGVGTEVLDALAAVET